MEITKFKEGQIPKKQLQIETYGGTDVMRSLESITDLALNISMAGKKLAIKKYSSNQYLLMQEISLF